MHQRVDHSGRHRPPGASAQVSGKSFKSTQGPNSAFSLTGKFTSTKALKGTYSITRQPVIGITCTSGPIAFKAKRTGN